MTKYWEAIEIELLESNLEDKHPLNIIQSNLHKAGYIRSQEAIRKKIRNLFYSNREQEDWQELQEQEFGNKELGVKTAKFISGAIPLKKNITNKFVDLNDVHVPHNVPLDQVFSFIEDFKPDHVILNGDIINNDPFSHWDKKSPLKFKTLPQPKQYYRDCNEQFYGPLNKITPQATKTHVMGNHEEWALRAIEEMPEGQGYWEPWNNIVGIDLWVQCKQIVNLGKLHFLHGDVLNGGRNHAAKLLSLYRRNIRYGHFHNLEEASEISPIDQTERHTVRCCGTLEQFNPSYMKNRPHGWINCFTYGWVEQDGMFFDHTTIINNGVFYANGKRYAG